LIISSTAVAIFFGGPVLDLAESRMLALFQVFVAGSLADLVISGVRNLFSHRYDPDRLTRTPVSNRHEDR